MSYKVESEGWESSWAAQSSVVLHPDKKPEIKLNMKSVSPGNTYLARPGA